MSSLSVSVIIATHNRASLLTRSMTSALKEMDNRDELIVVDDGSTDDTASVVSRFGSRIRYVSIPHSGAGRARNVGVGRATRDLVAFLDSDDEYLTGRLVLARRLLQSRTDVLFTFSDMAGSRKSGVVEPFLLRSWHQDPRPWDQILGPGIDYSKLAVLPEGVEDFKVYIGDLYSALARAPYATTITMTVRREEAGSSLYFDEDWPLYEDWGCLARLAREGKVAYLEIETARQHSHRQSRLTSASTLTHLATRVELLERIWGSDPDYLGEYAEEYHRLLDHRRRLKVRQLLILGRRLEASHELNRVICRPLLYTALAFVPGPLTRVLVFLIRPFWRWMRK